MAAVTSANPMLRVELVVYFDVELPSRRDTKDYLSPVRIRIRGVRNVGMRIQIQNRLPNWIYSVSGNYVTGKLIVWARGVGSLAAGARIINSRLIGIGIIWICQVRWTLRKVPRAL